MPHMPLTSAANSSWVEPQALQLRLGSTREVVSERKSTLLVHPDGRAMRPQSSPALSSSSATSRPSKTRCQTGPVDVDEGAFVEVERHLKAIHDMAAEHLAFGEYEEALEVFEEIFRGQLERYGPDHVRVGTALHNIGIVHLKSGNFPKAVEICELAVSVRKRAQAMSNPADVAVSLAQLGVAHLECQRYRDALMAFREALTIRREVLGPKHPKVGKILNNIGCALYELEDLEGAHLAFQEALDIQRQSLRRAPVHDNIVMTKSTSNQILLSVAATLCNIGSIHVRWSRLEEATLALEEALLVSDLLQFPLVSCCHFARAHCCRIS